MSRSPAAVPSSLSESGFGDTADDAVRKTDDLVRLVGDRLFVRDADDGHAHINVHAARYDLLLQSVQGQEYLKPYQDQL